MTFSKGFFVALVGLGLVACCPKDLAISDLYSGGPYADLADCQAKVCPEGVAVAEAKCDHHCAQGKDPCEGALANIVVQPVCKQDASTGGQMMGTCQVTATCKCSGKKKD